MKQLTDKQKKALWIVASALVLIHYAPTILNTIRQQSAAYRLAHQKPQAGISDADRVPSTPAPPPAPAAPSVPPDVAQLSALVGIWGGSMPVPNVGICEIRLELKPGTEKPGFTGYSTMSCSNVQRIRPGQRSNPQNLNSALLDATPVSAILSGEIKNGSIDLQQEKAIGVNSKGCNIVSVSLVPFSEQLAMNWKEGPANWKEKPESSCEGGQVIMHRVRTL
jgi:hypothetical protein